MMIYLYHRNQHLHCRGADTLGSPAILPPSDVGCIEVEEIPLSANCL